MQTDRIWLWARALGPRPWAPGPDPGLRRLVESGVAMGPSFDWTLYYEYVQQPGPRDFLFLSAQKWSLARPRILETVFIKELKEKYWF